MGFFLGGLEGLTKPRQWRLTGVGVSSNFFGSGGGLESRSLLLSFLQSELTHRLNCISRAQPWKVNLGLRNKQKEHQLHYVRLCLLEKCQINLDIYQISAVVY